MLCCVAAAALMGVALRVLRALRGDRGDADGAFPPPARFGSGPPAGARADGTRREVAP